MGSLATHFSTFAFLVPIGLHRLHCCITQYVKDPSHYRSKPWFFYDPRWKNIHFYALLIALPIASLSDLILFLSFSTHPTYRFTFLHHSLLILLFWVLLILIMLQESFDLWVINESFVFVFGGVCFVVEYFVDSNGFVGVSSFVYGLLGCLTLVCACSCLVLSMKPASFLGDLLLSCGLVFKGTWVLQAGVNLYTKMFGLFGCNVLTLLPDQDKADIVCDLDDDSLRGIALMNLLFVVHAILVLVVCFGLFGLISCSRDLRCVENGGPLLARIESHGMIMQSLPEVEME